MTMITASSMKHILIIAIILAVAGCLAPIQSDEALINANRCQKQFYIYDSAGKKDSAKIYEDSVWYWFGYYKGLKQLP